MVLVLLAASAWSIASSLSGSSDGSQELLRRLDAAVKAKPIPSTDLQAIRNALEEFSTSSQVRFPLSAMPASRRQKLDAFIDSIPRGFRSAPFDTPLQNQLRTEQARLNLESYFEFPTFAETSDAADIARRDEQIDLLVDMARQAAENNYPDIVGSSVPGLVRDAIKARYQRWVEDDMTAAFKHPLGKQEFSDLLETFRQDAGSMVKLGLAKNGHLHPQWETMSPGEREAFLKKNAIRLRDCILTSLQPELHRALTTCVDTVAQQHFPGLSRTLPSLTRDPGRQTAYEDLMKAALAEEQEILQQEVKRMNEELDRKAIRHELLAAGFQPPATAPAADVLDVDVDTVLAQKSAAGKTAFARTELDATVAALAAAEPGDAVPVRCAPARVSRLAGTVIATIGVALGGAVLVIRRHALLAWARRTSCTSVR